MDVTKMLEELLEFEKDLQRDKSDLYLQQRDPSTSPNSTTATNQTPIEQKQVSFTERQPGDEITTVTKSILKSSTSNIVPDYVPMIPQEYDSDDYSSRFDSDCSLSDSESGGSFSEEDSELPQDSDSVQAKANKSTSGNQLEEVLVKPVVDPIVPRLAGLFDSKLVDSYIQPDSRVKFEETKVSILPIEQEAPKMHFFGQKIESASPLVSTTHTVPPVVQFYGQQIPLRESDSDSRIRTLDSNSKTQSIDGIRKESELGRNAVELQRSRDEDPPPEFKLNNYDTPSKQELYRKIITRVYFETPANFKTIEINSAITAREVIDMITNLPEMALFELINDIGIERPLREWELVFSVLSNWTPGNNCIIVKKYDYCSTLKLKYLNERFPRVQGYIYTEIRSKWRKRFFELRDHLLYYYESAEDPASLILVCDLTLAHVYNLAIKLDSPTDFVFAIKSKIQGFQNEETTRFLCVKNQERLLDWVLALRMAKGERMRRLDTDFDTQSVLSDAQSVVSLDSLPLIQSLKIQEERRRKSKGKKVKDGKEKSRRFKPLLDFKNDAKCKRCGCVLGGDTKKICSVCKHIHSLQ